MHRFDCASLHASSFRLLPVKALHGSTLFDASFSTSTTCFNFIILFNIQLQNSSNSRSCPAFSKVLSSSLAAHASSTASSFRPASWKRSLWVNCDCCILFNFPKLTSPSYCKSQIELVDLGRHQHLFMLYDSNLLMTMI